jgi:hypothetical protein
MHDAPCLRGHASSHFRDLAPIVEKASSLKRKAGSGYINTNTPETLTGIRFRRIFGIDSPGETRGEP